MASTDALTKRVAISKSNTQIVIVVSIASFVTIFCLVAAKTMWSQNSYQARVVSADKVAHQQLVNNINAYNNLTSSYETFVSSSTNVIGGQSSGSGDKDGNNAKIVLDALPPAYDFPAVTSSIEKILTGSGLKVTSISGLDDELNQQSNTSSPNPVSVSIPFSFTISNASYQAVGLLINELQQSIRPIQIDSVSVTGGSNDITLTVNAHTYYQPSKTLSITKKEIK